MPTRINIADWIGQKRHKLTLLGETEIRGHRRFIKVKCDCGTIKFVEFQNWKGGGIKTCGCEMYPKTNNSKHPLYPIWQSIKQRCNNPNREGHENYYGKGVKICQEWENDFPAFRDWCLSNGWRKGLQVDKDAKGGLEYSPENCTILTPAKNTQLRSVVKLKPEDIPIIRESKMSAAKLAKIYGVCREHIRNIKIGKKWKEL